MTGTEMFLCAVTFANFLATGCIWRACVAMREALEDIELPPCDVDSIDNEALLGVIEANHATLYEPLMTAIKRLPTTRSKRTDKPAADKPIELLPVDLPSPKGS